MRLTLMKLAMPTRPALKALFVLAVLVSGSVQGQTPTTLALLRQRLTGPAVAAHQGGLFGPIPKTLAIFEDARAAGADIITAALKADLFGPAPNTLAAFENARVAGADVVEMDLRASSDGTPIVFHDEELSKLTNCTGPANSKTVAELKQCRFRGNPEAQIPTFKEILDWSQGRIVVDAEFKDFKSIAPALELVRRYNAHAWTYFQAQSSEEKYRLARALDPDVALLYAATMQEKLDWALSLQDENLLVIEIDSPTRTAENIAAIHRAGKLVTEDAWHFSSPLPHELADASCATAFALGIDIAVSNRPESCARQRDKLLLRK